jgi:hypothetical protein
MVTVAERSKACTVFPRSEAGIVGSNPTQGMDVWCLCTGRERPCDELITRPRSPSDCLRSSNRSETESFMEVGQGPYSGTVSPKKKKHVS